MCGSSLLCALLLQASLVSISLRLIYASYLHTPRASRALTCGLTCGPLVAGSQKDEFRRGLPKGGWGDISLHAHVLLRGPCMTHGAVEHMVGQSLVGPWAGHACVSRRVCGGAGVWTVGRVRVHCRGHAGTLPLLCGLGVPGTVWPSWATRLSATARRPE